jgi:voltage-gated potassium channel Kch
MGRWNPVERRIERFLREPPSVRNAAAVIVVATALIVVAAGVLITLLDGEEYPDLETGLWWALQTVTTVGYGDVTPSNLSGRVVGAVVMLEGIAFIAIVTALITSTFVTRATREADAARTEGEASDRELIERRFDDLERKLDRLVAGHDEAGP